MKQLTMNLMAAAVVVLAAGSASAQTLKADIPFTFHAAGAVLPAGTYIVHNASNLASRYVVIRNADTKKAVLAMYSSTVVSEALQARGTAGIQFECAGAECALRQMWNASGGPAYAFNGPKVGSDGERHMALIPLTTVKAD